MFNYLTTRVPEGYRVTHVDEPGVFFTVTKPNGKMVCDCPEYSQGAQRHLRAHQPGCRVPPRQAGHPAHPHAHGLTQPVSRAHGHTLPGPAPPANQHEWPHSATRSRRQSRAQPGRQAHCHTCRSRARSALQRSKRVLFDRPAEGNGNANRPGQPPTAAPTPPRRTVEDLAPSALGHPAGHRPGQRRRSPPACIAGFPGPTRAPRDPQVSDRPAPRAPLPPRSDQAEGRRRLPRRRQRDPAPERRARHGKLVLPPARRAQGSSRGSDRPRPADRAS